MPTGRALAVLAVLAISVGCGGEASDGDPPQKTAEVGGLATYDVASAGFEIGVPEDWEAVSVDEILSGGKLDEFIDENPEFEQYREMLSSPDSPFKFVAADPDVEDDFATNVNVVVSPVPQSVTFEQYKQALLAEVESLAPGNPIEQDVVSLPAGRAVRMSYLSEFTQEGETRELSTLQYGFLHEGKTYVVTYTTLPDRDADYADEFESSVRSFRFR